MLFRHLDKETKDTKIDNQNNPKRLLHMPEKSLKNHELNDDELKELKTIAQKEVMDNVDRKYLGRYRDEEAKTEINKQIIRTIQREYPDIPYSEIKIIAKNLTNEISGYGPLEKHLNNPHVTEILVEKYDKIVVEKDGKLQETGESFSSEDDLRLIAERIVTPLGRRLDWTNPTVDARLPDGSRVCAVIPPIAVDGTQLAIRKFKPNIHMDKLIKYETLNQSIKDALVKCVQGRLAILVSGGTGSGKSTFLNALSAYINPELSIITIENPIELQFKHPRVRRWEARPANIEGKGEISIRHLVITALRSRPDIIIIGEVRGAEAYDLMQALNTGHDGSMSTAHANNPEEAMKRLVSMVASAGELTPELVPEYVAGGIDIVVQLSRMPDGSRKLVSIHEVEGIENGKVKTNPLVEYDYSYNGKKVIGEWKEVNSHFIRKKKLEKMGIEFKGWV